MFWMCMAIGTTILVWGELRRIGDLLRDLDYTLEQLRKDHLK